MVYVDHEHAYVVLLIRGTWSFKVRSSISYVSDDADPDRYSPEHPEERPNGEGIREHQSCQLYANSLIGTEGKDHLRVGG